MQFGKKATVSFITATLLLTNLHVMNFNNKGIISLFENY